MEQAVWLYAGVISVLIGLAIVASLVYNSYSANKPQQLDNAISELSAKANFICSSDSGTMLSQKVTLVAGTLLVANNSGVCYEYAGKRNCAPINCVFLPYVLNLTDPAIAEAYSTHDFNCEVSRVSSAEGDISLDCQG